MKSYVHYEILRVACEEYTGNRTIRVYEKGSVVLNNLCDNSPTAVSNYREASELMSLSVFLVLVYCSVALSRLAVLARA